MVVPYEASCARGLSIAPVFLKDDTENISKSPGSVWYLGQSGEKKESSDLGFFMLIGLTNVCPTEDTHRKCLGVGKIVLKQMYASVCLCACSICFSTHLYLFMHLFIFLKISPYTLLSHREGFEQLP